MPVSTAEGAALQPKVRHETSSIAVGLVNESHNVICNE